MKIAFCSEKNIAKILLFWVVVTLCSCNTLKRVEENQHLLSKNTIYADDVKVKSEDIQSLLLQKPNTNILGYPLRLNLYNLAKKNPDSSFNNWLYRKENRRKKLANILSEKQVDRLGESFLVKGLSVWLKNVGEPPVTLDTLKTRKSLERLSLYYGSKGYFNNNTTYKVDSTYGKKRVALSYNITLGKPFYLDSLATNITSAAVDSIYIAHKKKSFVKSGKQFDLTDFNNEKERLTNLLRNNGVYNFQESSIDYNILRDTIKSNDDQKMNVRLNIADLKKRNDSTVTSSTYKVYKFKAINIYTDNFLDTSQEQNSITYGDYTIHYKGKLRYTPKTLTDAIFFKKDSVYREINRVRTFRQINNLNTFKYPNISFVEDSTQNYLTAQINLSPRKKYSFESNIDVTRSNIRRLGIGVGGSLLIRNIFRGSETLSVSGKGSFGLLSNRTLTEDFFSEISGDVNLNFPRIWFPLINTDKFIPNYMLPRTRLSLGTSFQRNIGLNKQTFNTILGYNWSPSEQKKNTVELINLQFVNNVNPNKFFNVYQDTYSQLNIIANKYDDPLEYPALAPFFQTPENSNNPALIISDGTEGFTNAILNREVTSTTEDFDDVRSIEERRIRLTENNLIFTSNYSFDINNKSGLTDNNFYQFRFKLESAGNLLSLASRVIDFEKNESDNLLVFGVPFSQYIKTEFDFVKYWDLSNSKVLAYRTFFGIAVPYGNSDNVPFVRSYFAGGANDNRAWNPYSLGPGRTSAINDFNEANLKLALNLEYRFPIVGNFKGALFADAGNIWNIWDNVENPEATFNGISSLGDIALGTGFGLRYDFTYFVARLDLGFKTYNPAEIYSERWFRQYNFSNSKLQIGINYPF